MRRFIDVQLGGIAAIFSYKNYVQEGLEQRVQEIGLSRGVSLLGAGHWLEDGNPLTELLFGYFLDVADAQDFLKRAHRTAKAALPQPCSTYTIFNGEKTMTFRPEKITQPGGYLIFEGEPVFVPGVKIHNFLETGKRFREPKGVHPRPRDALIDKIVLHSTASERVGEKGAMDLLRNMSNRKDAGCHIFIENGGEVWQFADLVTEMTSHASHRIVKPTSIGFEVSNYQWLKDHSGAPSAGKNREKYEATIHGWRTTHADYYPEQHASVLALCTAICDRLGIPKEVMRTPWRVRSNRELRSYRGVLAHLHCARGDRPKTCPGSRPLDMLAQGWGLD